jgi:hypothetical protein
MKPAGLFWLAYAIAYACALGLMIAWVMRREPMTTTTVRPDVPAHQLSVNPWREWR